MHTSTRMGAGDFQFWRHNLGGAHPVDFAAFCPGYHELDRIGVVSLNLEDGILATSYALLALTTAFYDRLRTQSDDFFDYPQHFAFVGAADAGVLTSGGPLPLDTPGLWEGWSWLDVWPDAKWVPTPATAMGMMQRVFDYQINRIFWPRSLRPDLQEPRLPDYAWKMLKTRLKAIYLYGDPAHPQDARERERLEICIAPSVSTVVAESFTRLPPAVQPAQSQAPFPPQVYEPVAVKRFLAAMQQAS